MNAILDKNKKRYEQKRRMEDHALNMGYLPYEPPLFEEYGTYEGNGELVTVMNNQQKLKLLRPDITTAMLKDLLPHLDGQKKTKLFYQSSVYRSHSQSVKEIGQYGVEYLGCVTEAAQLEILEMAIHYLKEKPFALEVGNTLFLDALLKGYPLNEAQGGELRSLLTAKNKDGLAVFVKRNRLPRTLAQIFSFRGSYKELLSLEKIQWTSEMLEILEEFSKISKLDNNIIIDFSLTNPQPYYSGMIFKGYIAGQPRAILTGGRYDRLTEKYEKPMGAIGFSIDMEGFTWDI